MKQRLKSIVGELLNELMSENKNYNSIANQQLIRYVSPLDSRIVNDSQISIPPLGGLIRIEAKDENSASQIREAIESSKLAQVDSVYELDRPLKITSIFSKQEHDYPKTVVVKQKAFNFLEQTLFKSCEQTEHIKQIFDNDENLLKRQKIAIEFSSPNIAKPFHFGHLKSTLLGNYLSNLYTYLGHQVHRINYLGDWGTQFGLLGLQLNQTQDFELDHLDKIDNPMRYLVSKYVEANARAGDDDEYFEAAKSYFMKMELDKLSLNDSSGSDRNFEKNESLMIWNKIRDLSLNELKMSYKQLNIEFDEFEFESDYVSDAGRLCEQLVEAKFARRLEDGAIVADVEKNYRTLETILQRSDGASLYLGRDLAAAVNRMKKISFDRMLYVAGAEQERHFHALKQIFEKNLMTMSATTTNSNGHESLMHVKTGKVLGMSTRSGDFLLLSDLIQEATSRFSALTQQTESSPIARSKDKQELMAVAKKLALSNIFIYDLRFARQRNYEFNWNAALASHNCTGLNMQATHARLCSLMKRAKRDSNIEPISSIEELEQDHSNGANFSPCLESLHLMSLLNDFDCVLSQSYWTHESAPLVTHANNLCNAINKARQSERMRVVKKHADQQDFVLSKVNLSLFSCANKQLAVMLRLLGLEPLEQV